MSKPKDNAPKPIVACADIDFIAAVTFLVVGTNYPVLKKKFLALMKKRQASMKLKQQIAIWGEVEAEIKDAAKRNFAGACIYPESDRETPFIWLPENSHRTLVHEIVHAVAFHIALRNLEPGLNSEVRAYLTDYLFKRFAHLINTPTKGSLS